MQFYNKNQIERMKITKQEFEITKSSSDKPETYLEQVLNPFVP